MEAMGAPATGRAWSRTLTNNDNNGVRGTIHPDPGASAEVVGYQDEMAQRYIANALARAGARKERDTSEAEESGGPP